MPRSAPPSIPPALREADARLKRVIDVARLLPALTAENAVEERRRLVRDLERGEAPSPRWQLKKRRVAAELWRCLEAARRASRGTLAEPHYEARVEELDLELSMLESLGEPRRVRPLSARRFGTGRDVVDGPEGPIRLADLAREWLETLPTEQEPRIVPATSRGGTSLSSMMRAVAHAASLDIDVEVEPRLTAGAATGDRTVFLADRRFGKTESLRFTVHEVLGHAVAAANARAQPIRLFQLGTAGGFRIQEGLAVTLEEQAGVLDAYRRRILAARVLVADRMHQGARFGDTARWLHRDVGFDTTDAIGLAERAYRGGGVARDVGYLRGWLEVRAAVASGETTIDHLRAGRVGLDVAKALPELIEAGLARPPRYCPSLSVSRAATEGGTSRDTSPPSLAASLTMLEET